MAPNTTNVVTLRRSCQSCAKGKRRCDRRWPKCSRCLGKGIDCHYINTPLTASTVPHQSVMRSSSLRDCRAVVRPSIHTPLRLEIAKEYDQSVIRFLVDGMRAFPSTFAQSCRTLFIHPDIYSSGLPGPMRDICALCKLNIQAKQAGNATALLPILWRKSSELHRQFIHASSLEDLLGCSQALVLLQCILALDGTDQDQHSESIGVMLEKVAIRLWQQAPVQLPPSLTPRHAWLLAESVRRTIIVSLMLRSAYSLKMRNYSVRTPFVDALPFDVRTELWDGDDDHACADQAYHSPDAMISLHEYSDAMETGRVHNVEPFGALILAACKGIAVSAISFPPTSSYIAT